MKFIPPILLLLVGLQGAARGGLRSGPFLVSSKPGSMEIHWTSREPEDAAVTWQDDSGGESMQVFRAKIPGQTAHAVILEGLSPGRRYRYILVTGGETHGPFRFSTPSDHAFRALILGEIGGDPRTLLTMLPLLRTGTVHSLILLGGLPGPKKNPRPFHDILGTLAPRIPFFCPRGLRPFFGEAAGDPGMGDSVLLPQLRGAGFHCAAVPPKAIRRPRELVEALRAVWKKEEKGARLVFLPVPLFHSSPRGADWKLRRLLFPVLLDCGVGLVISPGERFYERSVPLCRTPGGPALVQIVTGGGGKGLTRADPAYWTAAAAESFHFLRFEAGEEGSRLEAVDSLGRIFDKSVLPGGKPVPDKAQLFLNVRLSPAQRDLMKKLEDSVAGINTRLQRDRALGLTHFSEQLRRAAGELSGWKKNKSFTGAGEGLVRAVQGLVRLDFGKKVSRLEGRIRLDEVRSRCARCHGLHR